MKRILVGVAWPYANGPFHVGHIAGAYLPADIFARYQRLAGRQVLMVSGSDTHGTPITVQAEKEGISPRELFQRYHRSFLESIRGLGLTFDLFTHTDTANHHRITQDFFSRLLERGYIFRQRMTALYCPSCRRFLPDRYVEGTCPHCGYEGARGDQCDQCGRPLDALELIEPRCRICGARPEPRETEHFFLDLPQFQDPLLKWVEAQEHWRPNVRQFTLGYLREGLKPRAITRDLDWGVEIPLEGYEGKRIYVWFDAVIGYFSASVEWAQLVGDGEAWRAWWEDPEARSYYFIGKDNIPFHTIIWPAMLMGYGDRNLPYDVPANEYLNLEGAKLSTSRNWAIWVPEYLERYDPDPLRYYLTINAPEGRDANFSWDDFVRRNNDELLAAWGNLIHRVLSFSHRHFGGVPGEIGELDGTDQALLAQVEAAFPRVGGLLDRCQFRAALQEGMALAREVNRYLDVKAPWFAVKEDRIQAATTLFVALRAIDSLKVLLAPFLPFISARLHELLGYETPFWGELAEAEGAEGQPVIRYRPGGEGRWRPSDLPLGRPFGRPTPLVRKLEASVAEEERTRLGSKA